MADRVKEFYITYHDRIGDKRHNSPYWIRRYAHRQIHAQFLPYIRPGQRVLDVGCGEGLLSCLIARQGIEVVGADISEPNVQSARRLAAERGVKALFVQADAERLPFADDSFDVVVSCHNLEHLPDLRKGLAEIRRLTKSLALIAMPTCLNPSCWALLGGATYWKLGKRSLAGVPLGLGRVIAAWLRGEEGPDEGYGGNGRAPHVWRFPWVMRAQVQSAGFGIKHIEAGPLILPYLAQYFPPARHLQEPLDACRGVPILRHLGYGTMVVCEKLSE